MCVYGVIQCEECGQPAEAGTRGRLKRFCSEACRAIASRRRWRRRRPGSEIKCAVCGTSIYRTAEKRGRFQKWCSDDCRKQDERKWRLRRRPKGCSRHCEQCGEWFSVEHKRRFCSKKCQEDANRFSEERDCQYCKRRFTAKSRAAKCCSDSCAQRLRHKHAGTSSERVCVGCGIQFMKNTSGRNAGRYHSRECAWESKRKIGQQRREARKIADGMLRWMQSWRQCGICGANYYKDSQHWPYIACSMRCENLRQSGRFFKCDGCDAEIDRLATPGKRLCERCKAIREREQKRAAKALRRARIMNNGPHEVIMPGEVFERDEWTCKLCGKPTLRTTIVPHPMAATLDHIVPLSKGGTHVMANVQCAHFECNWMKSDKQDGQGASTS